MRHPRLLLQMSDEIGELQRMVNDLEIERNVLKAEVAALREALAEAPSPLYVSTAGEAGLLIYSEWWSGARHNALDGGTPPDE